MKTMMPRLASIAVLMNPGNSTHAAVLKNVEDAADSGASRRRWLRCSSSE